MGGASDTDTIVAWNGWLRISIPAAVSTVISPELVPSSLGKSITRLRPISSTVVVKSVPLIAIFAEGVFINMFSLLILPSFPVINLAVPLAIRKDNFDLEGSGS